MTKYAKTEVDFEHPAKGMDHCRDCKHFMQMVDRCRLVLGRVEPNDWCNKFEQAE